METWLKGNPMFKYIINTKKPYSISHPLAPDCQGRATSLPDTHANLTMYFNVYMNMFGHQLYMYTVVSI